MKNPEFGSNDQQITTSSEWDSLEKISRADLPTTGTNYTEAPGFYGLSEEAMSKNETNINSKTGKERSFSDMDLYSRDQYESTAAQGEHRRERNDLIVWTELIPYDAYVAKYDREKTSAEINHDYTKLVKSMIEKYPRGETEQLSDYRERAKGIVDSISNNNTKQPLDKQAEFDRMKDKLTTAAEEGRMSEAHVKKLIEKYLDRFIDKKIQKSEAKTDQNDLIEALLHPKGFESDSSAATPKPEVKPTPDVPSSEKNPESKTEFDPEIRAWIDAALSKAKEEILAKAKEKQAALDREKDATGDTGTEGDESGEGDKDTGDEGGDSEGGDFEAEDTSAEGDESGEGDKDTGDEGESFEGENEGAEEEDKEGENAEEEELLKQKIEDTKKLFNDYIQGSIEYGELLEKQAQAGLEQISEIKKNIKKRPGFGLWVASFFAGKKRRKAPEAATKDPKDDEKPENAAKVTVDPEGIVEVKFRTASDMDREEYHFWSSIGEEGLKIMTDTEPLNEEKTQAIEKWWGDLDDQSRATFLEDMKGNRVGLTLRTFLINKELIPKDEGQYLNYDFSRMTESEKKAQEKRIKEGMDRIVEDYLYWNAIGDEGIKYITGEEPFNGENAEKILNWWNSLDDQTKGRIKYNSLPTYRKLMEGIKAAEIY